jgi:hypothetical protein
MVRDDHPVVLPATRYTGIGVWDRAAARERSFRLARSDRKRLHVSTFVIHSASRLFGRGGGILSRVPISCSRGPGGRVPFEASEILLL